MSECWAEWAEKNHKRKLDLYMYHKERIRERRDRPYLMLTTIGSNTDQLELLHAIVRVAETHWPLPLFRSFDPIGKGI